MPYSYLHSEECVRGVLVSSAATKAQRRVCGTPQRAALLQAIASRGRTSGSPGDGQHSAPNGFACVEDRA